MRIRIVTDSSTNIPDSYLAQLGIVEVPAVVNFGTESILNKVQLSTAEFYRRLADAEKMPTTAQPAPRQFADGYEQLAAEGAEEVIAVSVSGKMSGTLNSMMVAAEHAPLKVHPWDSLSAAMGAGWQAIAAAEMARSGLDCATILQKLAPIRARMQTVATPATLRYLVACGRAPRVQGAIGDILNVKPLLSMVDGILEPVGRVRGRRRALAQMLDLVAAAIGDGPARLAVAHTNIAEEAARFLDAVKARFNAVETTITDLGPALGCFAGPGLMALAGYAIDKGGAP